MKRKRETVVARRQSPMEGGLDAIAGYNALRQHFEAVFEPLPQSAAQLSSQSDVEVESDDSHVEESDWDGLSDDSQPTAPVVQVFEHMKQDDLTNGVSDAGEFKAFMSSKPPKETHVVKKAKAESESESESETLNLKHDLDLQRLLKESHLLESGKAIDATGTQRHKATDLRIQNLGSKASLFEQQKMPMSHRKGINAKALTKDARRRKDAAENGIILEKAQTQSSSSRRSGPSKRERGVDAPTLGKFRGGTLRLSSKDIAGMQDQRSANRRRARK